jgi:hypothetical protein
MVHNSGAGFRIRPEQEPNAFRAAVLGPLRTNQDRALALNVQIQPKAKSQNPMTKRHRVAVMKLQNRSLGFVWHLELGVWIF